MDESMERAQLVPRRRISDLLVALDFCEVQLEMLQRGRPHRARHLGLRIAALHHRLDQLERAIRVRAAGLVEDDGVPLSDLRKRLLQLERRQSAVAAGYKGRDRRRRLRRATDPRAMSAETGDLVPRADR